MTEMPAQEEAYRFAEMIHENNVRAIVVNMEHAPFDQGLAAQLAEQPGRAVLPAARDQGRVALSDCPHRA
jgi:Mg-chelatase subunit ChlD